MTTVKVLAIATLLVGGTSLALAQGPPGPGVNPAPNYGQSAAPPTGTASQTRTATKPHKKMYMSTKSHKGSKLTPTGTAKPQMKQ